MILKVEFYKAYDLVSWEYLLEIMEFKDFNHKWIRCTQVCWESSSSLVLINGNPTKDFTLKRCNARILSYFYVIGIVT